MQITADIGKILKNVQGDLTFILDVLSESPICFVSFLVFLAVETRQRTMRKYLETLHVNIGHNLA